MSCMPNRNIVVVVDDDPGMLRGVERLLRQHAYGGNVVLISSHDEAVIAAADRVLTLADGRLVSDRRAGSAPLHR